MHKFILTAVADNTDYTKFDTIVQNIIYDYLAKTEKQYHLR